MNGVVAKFLKSVVVHEHGEYCVKSPNNKDWSGGCYPSEADAEKRLREVEYFKKHADLVVAKYKQSMEFPTEEAKKKYLHEHPDADASNHTVKKDHALKTRKPNMFDRATLESEKHLKTIYNTAKKLNGNPKDAKALADKVHKAGGTLIDHAVNVHKEMARGKHDDRDFKALGDDQRNLEETLEKHKADGLDGFGAHQILEAANKLYGTLYRVTAIHGASQ